MKEIAFADPGTSTYDLRPARVTWSATRGGPWGSDWQDPFFEVVGMSAAATPVYAMTHRSGVSTGATVTDWALALPADVRLVACYFYPNEVAVWDAADAGDSPIPVTVGGTTTLPFTFDEASAYRSFFTKPYWASGKPGTALRLALQNFPAGSEVAFSGWSESPNGVATTWGGKSLTSTGPQQQTVSLTVPAKAKPGYSFVVVAGDATARYNIVMVAPMAYFQVCTLNATKTSIRRRDRGEAERRGPDRGPLGLDARQGQVRVDLQAHDRGVGAAHGLGRHEEGLEAGRARAQRRLRPLPQRLAPRPARTTWYVARYAGDDQYRRAYTSVLRVPRRSGQGPVSPLRKRPATREGSGPSRTRQSRPHHRQIRSRSRGESRDIPLLVHDRRCHSPDVLDAGHGTVHPSHEAGAPVLCIAEVRRMDKVGYWLRSGS